MTDLQTFTLAEAVLFVNSITVRYDKGTQIDRI